MKNLKLSVTEKTHKAVPFLQIILAHKRGQITFESAFTQLKEQGYLAKETKYADFLDTLSIVCLNRVILTPLTTELMLEQAIVTAQKEQRKFLRVKNYLKRKSNV